MIIRKDEEWPILSNGKAIYVHAGLISVDLNHMELYGGYDHLLDEDDYGNKLTTENRIEIADRMILRWTKYKKKLMGE